MSADTEFASQDHLSGSLIDAFRSAAENSPRAPALHLSTGVMTYSELAGATFGLAGRILDRLGIGSEPVMVLNSQGVGAITSMLAVLASGKFYVPLDPGAPKTHSRNVTRSTTPRLVLTEPQYADIATGLEIDQIMMIDPHDKRSTSTPPVEEIDPFSNAYVYFTSGSTGKPKGVVDSHRNVLHNVFRYTSTLDFDDSDRMSLIQSPDISAVVSTMFGALCNGASLCPTDVANTDPQVVVSTLTTHEITVFHAVPALFRFLSEYGLGATESLRLIRLEGDRATSNEVDVAHQNYHGDLVLVNGLGATECGLVRQFFVEPGEGVEPGPLPVGYSVPDIAVEVVDDKGHPVEPGAQGEVVVRSDFLASGYWADDALTNTRFRVDSAGRRTYHTGDIGRLGSDDCLKLLGRTDDIVKIRGVPLHLGSVEALILSQREIKETMVTVDQTGSYDRLVARVTCVGDAVPDSAAIRRSILEQFPTAAIPQVIHVDSLPSTRAGKLER